MKKNLLIISFVMLITLAFSEQAQAITLWNSHSGTNDSWEAETTGRGLDYFLVDIPASITTLVAGTPLYTGDPSKYLTFSENLLRTIVNDSVEGDFAMFSTNEVDSVIMSLHGFSALGFGLQMRPNDGTYQEGIEYLNKSFSGWGSSTANPDFYGFITDGASLYSDLLEKLLRY